MSEMEPLGNLCSMGKVKEITGINSQSYIANTFFLNLAAQFHF